MTARWVPKGAVLLALLSGCSPHRSAVQQTKPVSTPVKQQVAAVPATKPVQPPAPRPFRALALTSLEQRVPVLTYHDVIGSRSQKDAVWFDCTAAEFEAQLTFLHDQGAHVITLEQLRRHLTTGEPLPDRAIALTFDDNYQGVYDHAAPFHHTQLLLPSVAEDEGHALPVSRSSV